MAPAQHGFGFGLPKRFADESFAFGKLFTGQRERVPRWKKCVNATTGVLGEAVGQGYVDKTFPPAAKARAKAIVDNMVEVLGERIQQLDWMSDSTKLQAHGKLVAFTRKIGYPDKWRDFSKLDVQRGEYLENQHRASAWEIAVDWAKVGKPVDKSEWGMTPSEVNAYYNPVWNEIVFPAGILRPPFFNPDADDAVNYGAMGAVIGHEMSHGFDDSGRRFDAQGNLRDWWTKADADKYKRRRSGSIDQFNAYTVVDSTTHVNGKLTLGENIGDLGGLKIAYLAMEKSLKEKGRPAKIDGFTPEQRFFLGWAQVWRTLQSDAGDQGSGEHRPARAGQVARQRPAQQHAGVQGRVGVQGRRRDGATGLAPRADLVASFINCNCFTAEAQGRRGNARRSPSRNEPDVFVVSPLGMLRRGEVSLHGTSSLPSGSHKKSGSSRDDLERGVVLCVLCVSAVKRFSELPGQSGRPATRSTPPS